MGAALLVRFYPVRGTGRNHGDHSDRRRQRATVQPGHRPDPILVHDLKDVSTHLYTGTAKPTQTYDLIEASVQSDTGYECVVSIQTALLGKVPSAFRFSQYEPLGHSYSATLASYISPLRM